MKRLLITESALWVLISLIMPASVTAQISSTLRLPAAGISHDAAKAQSEDLIGLVRQISVEVRKLKFEVQRLHLENQRVKILPLERELQELQSARKQFDEQEKTLTREITHLETQLGPSTLASEERAGAEASQAEMARNTLERLRRDQQMLAQKEAELNRRLALEQERWQEMFGIAKVLRAEADGNAQSR